MVGVQGGGDSRSRAQSGQTGHQGPAGQHQRQEHQRPSPERTHTRQPAATAPGRGAHAGQSCVMETKSKVTFAHRALYTIQTVAALH